jgi:hypothetical protein
VGRTMSAVVSFTRVASDTMQACSGWADEVNDRRRWAIPVLLGAWQTSEMGLARRWRSPSHPAL